MSELEPDRATAEEDTQVGEEVVSGTPLRKLEGFPVTFEALAVRKKRHGLDRAHITLGREKTCDIVVRTPGVSRMHAHFLPGPPLTLVDPGSHNGTFVDGERLAAGEARVLKPGQEIILGDLVTRLVLPADLYGLLKTTRS